MICLNNTDTLEGGASVNAVVDYTVHGLVGSTFTRLAAGQLSNTDPSVIYTAAAAISIVSITLVNTHSAAVTVNLYLDPANAGTPRRMIPKNVSLGVGYALVYDGQRFSVMNADGNILSSVANVTGLSGLLADDQHPLDAEVLAVAAALSHGALHRPNAADPIGLPKFSAHKNEVDQTGILTSTHTKITFSTELYDDGSAYDAPNSKWIPGIVGKAHISANVLWVSASDQCSLIILVYKNGASNKEAYTRASGTGLQSVLISCDVLVNAITDYFEIYAYQDSGSNKDIAGYQNHTWFMGHMLP